MHKPKSKKKALPRSVEPLNHPGRTQRKARRTYKFIPRLTGRPELDAEILDPAYEPKPISLLDIDLMSRFTGLSRDTIQLHVDEAKAPEDQCEALFRQFNLETPERPESA